MENGLFERLLPYLEGKEILMERFAGRIDLWAKCVNLFPEPSVFSDMEEALKQRDFQKIRGNAHNLKGVLANFGFMDASQSAENLLVELRKESPESELVSEALLDLRGRYLRIFREIKVRK